VSTQRQMGASTKSAHARIAEPRKKVAVKAPDLTAKHRLRTTVAPVAYRLSIEPHLSDFTYTGAVEIDIDVRKRTNRVVLNAVGLSKSSMPHLMEPQPRHRSMHRVSGLMLSRKSRCLKGRPRLPHPHPVRLHHSSWNFGGRSETSDNFSHFTPIGYCNTRYASLSLPMAQLPLPNSVTRGLLAETRSRTPKKRLKT
jgi:hypothetical protein